MPFRHQFLATLLVLCTSATHALSAEENSAAIRKQLLQHAYQITLTGDYLHAADECERALHLARQADAGEDAAAAEVELAFVLRESGDLTGALGAIDQAIGFYRAHPEFAHGLISAEQARGIVYLEESDFAHALESFYRALALSEKVKYRDGIIPALNSIGEVYRTEGQPKRALEFYERARAAVGDDQAWNMAFVFNNIGMSYSALGEFERAVESIKRARAVAEKAKFRPRVESSLGTLGDLEFKRGNLDAARDDFAQSLQLARELHDIGGEARALLGSARVARARGEVAAARLQAQQAVALSRKVAQLDQLVPALTFAGECAADDKEARRSFEEAIAAVEKMRGQVAGGDVARETFFAQQIEPYHRLVSLLVRQGEPEKALAIAERASARVLLDMARAGRVEWAALLSTDERKRQQQFDLQLAGARRELRNAGGEKASKAVEKAERAEEDFEAALEEAHPELRRTTPSASFDSLGSLAPLLQEGRSTLLRYVVTEEEAYLFLIRLGPEKTKPELKVISLGKGRAEIGRLTSAYRARLALRSLAWEKDAGALYDLLLRPVETELRQASSIMIVPDGSLWELPFQTLESGADHPLLVEHAVSYAPSLSLLARAQQNGQEPTPEHALLAFANPALGDSAMARERGWQPLPQMDSQARELEKIYPSPSGKVLVGNEAREKVFKHEAANAAILHLATHGVLNDRAPLYSYLLFSQVNLAPEEDGRLEARELMHIKLRARLAILCGCETARGEVTAGEGVVGLSWAFMAAGCPATIVSQWKVDSASSTQLMVELHRGLHEGVEKAEALRQASLALRKNERYQHPFYWAPFVLIGR